MSAFSDNMKRFRFERGMTQEEFAKLLGTSKQNISRYESGNTTPLISKAQQIADVLGVTLKELNEEPERPMPGNLRPLDAMHRQRVPLIGRVAAGQPIMAEESYETWLNAPVKCDAALEVVGDSMAPGYLPGDIVYIRCQSDIEYEGQIAVVLIDEEATLKHVYKRKGGLTLISDNPRYAPMLFEFSECEYMAIYGIPVGFTRMY